MFGNNSYKLQLDRNPYIRIGLPRESKRKINKLKNIILEEYPLNNYIMGYEFIYHVDQDSTFNDEYRVYTFSAETKDCDTRYRGQLLINNNPEEFVAFLQKLALNYNTAFYFCYESVSVIIKGNAIFRTTKTDHCNIDFKDRNNWDKALHNEEFRRICDTEHKKAMTELMSELSEEAKKFV